MSYFSNEKLFLARLYRSVLCRQSLLGLMVPLETCRVALCCTEASTTFLSKSSKPEIAAYLTDMPRTVPMVWIPRIPDIRVATDQSSVPIHTLPVTLRSTTNGKKPLSFVLLEKTTMVLTLVISMLSTMFLMILIVSSLSEGMIPW